MRWTSRSAPVWASKRLVAMASTCGGRKRGSVLLFQQRAVASTQAKKEQIQEERELTSSMKMIEGAFSLAILNTSLTILGPSPKYFCTNSDPLTRMNDAVVW
jgi:hypothetical protein